jgi:hypothetical protein
MRQLVCPLELKNEFVYWKIDYESHLDVCCLRDFENIIEMYLDQLPIEDEVIEHINFREDFGTRFFPKIREKIYYMMEVPRSSIRAKFYLIFSSCMISLSVIEFIIKSNPTFNTNSNKNIWDTSSGIDPFNVTEGVLSKITE